ncbi:GNAT family N-acetyltransferase [Oxalobacteraceae bacterium]|nr:GNAT family N-acetyltransferase [Oxalobacteraceae bacterium]
MEILRTARLRLRTIHAGDAAFYFDLVNDPSWIQHIGQRNIHTLDAARAAILDGPCLAQLERGFSLYLVEQLSDGAPIGLCGLLKRDTLPDVDIGYALRPAYWGQGYAYEAAAAVVAHARDDLKLKRLLGITSPENLVSNRLLQKLGLVFVEFVQLTSDNSGSNLYSIEFPTVT